MHDPRPPYLEGHHPHHHHHHHCGLHNDNLPHIHNPNSHPDGLDCHHHHHDPSCGCHDHLPPDLHCLDVIPRFRFHEKDGETRGFHRTSVAYRDIILSALKNYPKLDEPAVAKAMWAFCKDIILRDEHGCCGVPVSEIDGESTHNICFTDHCGHELSKIQFYRTPNEAGVRIGVGEYSFGIRSFNGSAPETWTLYPSNPNSAQIARCDWVLDKIEDLLNEFLLNADEIPTQGSNNVVKSGGVYDWVLGLINQEISERLAGDKHLQDQIDALDLSKYEMHQYPHSGHTTQVVSCDGIYKYGQDILKEAKEYCDGNHSGEGGSGGDGSSGGGFAGLVWAFNKSTLNKDGPSHEGPGNVTNIAIGEIVTGDKLAKSFDIGEGGAIGGDVAGNGESGIISAENSDGSGYTTLYHCGYEISSIVTLDSNKKYRAIYAPSYESTSGGGISGPVDSRVFIRWMPGLFAIVADDEEEIPSVLGGSSGSLYFYAKNPFYNSLENGRDNYGPPYNSNNKDQESTSGGASGTFCKLKTGDIIPATQLYRAVYVYYYNNSEKGFMHPSGDYSYVTGYDRMNFWFIDPISTDPSVKYKVAAPGYVYSGNKDNWSKTPGSHEGYGYSIRVYRPNEHDSVNTYIKGCDLELIRIS